MDKRRLIQAAAAMAMGHGLPVPAALARTQSTRIIVPYAAGGTTDIVARIIQNGIGNRLGHPVIVENKPGVNGVIGASLTYSAPGDGSAIMVGGTDTNVIYALMYRKPRFDATKFVPIAPIGESPHILLARPGLALHRAGDLVQLARQQSLSYASWGPSSSGNLAMTALRQATRMPALLHVPYTSASAAVQAIMADQVDLMFAPAPTAMAMAGKTKLLCVYANQRAAAFPYVPAMQEAGLDMQVQGSFWMGFYAPPGTSLAVARQLNAAITEAVGQAAIHQKLKDTGITPQIASLQAYQDFYRQEFAAWAPIIQATGIALD